MGLKIGNLETYGIIYKIENLVNGKVYIGQTTNDNGFNGRYHNDIVKYTHNKHLKRSFKKYGLDNFEINEMFDIAFSKEELDIKEKCWINIYDSCNLEKGYNNADGGSRGKIHKTGTMIYNIDTGYRGLENKQSIDYDKYDLFIISEYIDNNKLGFELDKIKCKIIYDRSDYWNYLDNNKNHECENELLKRADLVINSSKFLFEDSLKYNKNSLLIENGTNDYFVPHSNDEKSVVYIGRSRKIDFDKLINLCNNNKTWKFKIILNYFNSKEIELIKSIPNIEIFTRLSYQECIKMISKSKFGLILLDEKNDFNKGMLSLKYFDYLKEGLITISNNYNIIGKDNVIEYDEKLKLDNIDTEIYGYKFKDQYLWKNIDNVIIQKIEEVLIDER